MTDRPKHSSPNALPAETPDELDRRAILARRQAWISSALAAVACTPSAEPEKPSVVDVPPPDTATAGVPIDTPPEPTTNGGLDLPAWDLIAAQIPPRDVSPGLDKADADALKNQEKRLNPLYADLAKAWNEAPTDCLPGRDACAKPWEEYLAELTDLRTSVQRMSPLCGFMSNERTVIVQRLEHHERFLRAQVEKLHEAVRDYSKKSGAKAEQALDELGNKQVIAVPCLSCMAPQGPQFNGLTIQFEEGSAKMLGESQLAIVVEQLQAHPGVKLEIRGHADPGETDGTKLSEERADAVIAALKARGIGPARLKRAGWGDKLLVGSPKTPEGKSHNRRVDFEPIP